jgi:hypothetical protein
MKKPSLIARICFHASVVIAILIGCLLSPGCTTPSANPVASALQNPNNEAKAVQDGIAAGATAFLANANNKQYAPELVAVADALAVVAAGNPQNLTAADISGLVATTKVSPATANEVSAVATALLGAFNSAFAVNFPTLKPNYAIFLVAVSNGLHIATGGTAQPLPVIPWPPVAVPAVTAAAPAP